MSFEICDEGEFRIEKPNMAMARQEKCVQRVKEGNYFLVKCDDGVDDDDDDDGAADSEVVAATATATWSRCCCSLFFNSALADGKCGTHHKVSRRLTSTMLSNGYVIRLLHPRRI